MIWKQPTYIGLLALLINLGGKPEKDSLVLKEGLGGWSSDGRRFIFRREVANYSLENNLETVVMVSYKPDSPFETRLRKDPRLLALYSHSLTGIGRAILSLKSSEERDELAAEAHEHNHVCGSIEVLDLSLQLTELGVGSSPKVPTSTKSESLQLLLDQINTSNLSATITSLQNLGTRYHAGTSPNQSSDLIKSNWQALLPAGASVTQVDHSARKSTAQKSVVLTIPATETSTETVVLGAHFDSINRSNQSDAPGADDNASGIAALTEILRIIKESGATFSRNVELHAYAAEEVGLVGSSDVASQYAGSSKSISAMMQLDMIGYSSVSSDDSLYLITTDTSPVLVRHLKDLMAAYSIGTMKTGTLDAGTSDHKSWTNTGFHAAFAFENPQDYNESLHTSSDTSTKLDFNLAARFTKLALAFLAHEAGLTTAVSDTASSWTEQKATADAIKLAVIPSSTGERLAAAVLGAADTAEFCKITSGAEIGCQTMNTDTTIAKEASGRVFFVTPGDVTIASDDIWRLNAYSASGTLLAMRSFKLKKN